MWMRRVISFFFLFLSPNEQRAGGGGGGALLDFFFFLFSLFSRPRAGLATVLSSFFGLATNALIVRNNNNNNNNSPPLCQTPGCRSGRNRSTLSPPTLSSPYCTLKVSENDSLRQPPAARSERRPRPQKVFSFATSSPCSHTRLSQGHGCTKPSDGLVSCAGPR